MIFKEEWKRRHISVLFFRISSGTLFKFRMTVMASHFFYSFLSFFNFFGRKGKKKHARTHFYMVETFSREREKGPENSIRLFLEIHSPVAPCTIFSGFFFSSLNEDFFVVVVVDGQEIVPKVHARHSSKYNTRKKTRKWTLAGLIMWLVEFEIGRKQK